MKYLREFFHEAGSAQIFSLNLPERFLHFLLDLYLHKGNRAQDMNCVCLIEIKIRLFYGDSLETTSSIKKVFLPHRTEKNLMSFC